MKHLIFPFLLLMLFALNLKAEDEKYIKAMEENLKMLKEAKTVVDMQGIANKFERIATMKPEEWLPNYWTAYCYAMMSFMENDNKLKDQYADQSEKFLAKIKIDNDEIWAIKAMAAQAKMVVDPMSRWVSDGARFSQYLDKAQAINPENPRIYYLRGQNLYYTPEQFGGGASTACPILKISSEKFAKFKPSSTIQPNWGERDLNEVLKNCK